ncbi:MAG: hypothetical protein GXY14_04025 [Spirochaetes bacterium]|mgnify:CR=1 FL=1|nr:hypothetical protein [Spirochaetota bacterium]
MKKILLVTALLLANVPLSPRDIDLDRMYINPADTLYSRLTQCKEKTYSAISSLAVDTRTIYAEWADGRTIIYIREYNSINIAMSYDRSSGKKSELARFGGTVTSSSLNSSGDTLVVKTLEYASSGPSAVIWFISLRGRPAVKQSSPYFFLDYTIIPGSDSILIHRRNGLARMNPLGDVKEIMVPASSYSSLANGEPVLSFISPDRKRSLLVTGRGGLYSARLLSGSSSSDIPGIVSPADLCWISNSMFAYSGGSAGEYSVNVYDSSARKKSAILTGTLNPDINFSREAGMLTCLDNQMIVFFSGSNLKRRDTGLEGEETYFSPDGRKFTSIYRGTLYVTSLNMLQKNRLAVRRNAGTLITLYRSALSDRGSWQNDYSRTYIEKKIRLYENFIKTMD